VDPPLIRICAALCLAALGVFWVAGAEASPGDYDKVFNGQATTDGALTPGASESIAIRKMPPRMKFGISVQPINGSAECPGYPTGLCDISVLLRSKNFVTSGHGRASVVFTMPTTYERWDFTHPESPPETIPFASGQTVEVGVAGSVTTKRKPKRLFRGKARTTGVITPVER
jgi:hypothetical protein